MKKGFIRNEKSHAVGIITGMGFFLAVIELLALDLPGRRGEAPCGSLFCVKLLASFLAQLVSGDELGHGITSFLKSG